jgi:DNA repair photolyase
VGTRSGRLRWRIADEEEEGALFADERWAIRHIGTGEYRGFEFLHVNAKRIINRVRAGTTGLGFEFTVNPYRGCAHACVYCFARPTHEYLGLDPGRDFERTIVVKVNAVERLRAELGSPRWRGDTIALGTNTDPYQPAEGRYHLTQGILRTLAECANPFSVLTKSTLVLRDLELLVDAATRTQVRLDVSVGTLDPEVWQSTEPGTPPPQRRLDAVRRLNEAGVPCGVLVAPILPGLSDSVRQIRAVVDAAKDAGAVSVRGVLLHLRPGVKEHFGSWLTGAHPELVARYERLFAHGPYQPRAEQDRIARVLAGGRPPPTPPRHGSHPPGRPDQVPVQLRLLP